jgi:hypothetical protein
MGLKEKSDYERTQQVHFSKITVSCINYSRGSKIPKLFHVFISIFIKGRFYSINYVRQSSHVDQSLGGASFLPRA